MAGHLYAVFYIRQLRLIDFSVADSKSVGIQWMGCVSWTLYIGHGINCIYSSLLQEMCYMAYLAWLLKNQFKSFFWTYLANFVDVLLIVRRAFGIR